MKPEYIFTLLALAITAVIANSFMEKSFTDMDKNEDGYLEEDEMRPFMAEGFEQLAKMDSDWLFKDINKNNDNYIDREELAQFGQKKTIEEIEASIKDGSMKRLDKVIYNYETQKFQICDKNKDGKLSRNEHWYFANSGVILPRFEHEHMWLEYDRNRDGKVLFDEFHNPEYIMPNMTPEQQRQSDMDFFTGRDLNKDGILDFAEVGDMVAPDRNKQAEEHINHLLKHHDTNKDAKLSKAEFMKTDMSLFESRDNDPPKLEDDDIAGPPAEPESMIDFEVYIAKGKDEL